MEPKTLEALNASIAKWERNAVAETPSQVKMYAGDCPLCHIYVLATGSCEGCPVAEKAGEEDCDGTPWPNTWFRWRAWASGEGAADEFREHARAEVAFLKSLLPTAMESGSDEDGHKIVRAVNSHAELVAALEEMLRRERRRYGDTPRSQAFYERANAHAFAALSRSKSE